MVRQVADLTFLDVSRIRGVKEKILSLSNEFDKLRILTKGWSSSQQEWMERSLETCKAADRLNRGYLGYPELIARLQ